MAQILIARFFFENINKTIGCAKFVSDLYVVVGDFNVIQNGELDRKGKTPNTYNPQAQKEIKLMMDEHDLVDVWRLKHPLSHSFTWRRQNRASRIYYFLVSFSFMSKVKQVLIEDKLMSDHQLISLHMQILEYPRGPGYWKFNQKLLDDSLFIEKTKSFLTHFFIDNVGSVNPLIVWDAFKCSFRGYAIKCGSYRQKIH